MKTNNIPKSLSIATAVLMVIVALGVVTPTQAAPVVKGQIVESSWSDRRISVRDENGNISLFIVPPKISIAGSVDVHKDSTAFRKHLRPKAKVRVVKGSQLRRSLFAAKDILPL
ncbi:MAG: hypothetical protein AAF585_00270 [Verrucomicrobiota bacterium]